VVTHTAKTKNLDKIKPAERYQLADEKVLVHIIYGISIKG
jgi:hypothetical protein